LIWSFIEKGLNAKAEAFFSSHQHVLSDKKHEWVNATHFSLIHLSYWNSET
jgi:hypothetical protein